MIDWSSEPDHINEQGVKWWQDEDMAGYARGKGIDDVELWYVERPDGYRTRVMTRIGEPIYDDQTAEGMACHIDMMWADKVMP